VTRLADIPGVAQAQSWIVGGALELPILDIEPSDDGWPWDVSVQPIEGIIELDVAYGGTARRLLPGLSTPFSVALPGSITIIGRRIGAGAARCAVSVTPASQVGGFMRSGLLTGPNALLAGAYRYHAVTDSTLSMSGNPLVVLAGDSQDITDSTTLTAGIGWVELAV